MKVIISIDPGQAGGIAVYDAVNDRLMEVVAMPATPLELLSFLSKYGGEETICYLERVGGIPGMGASAMFNFGKGFGHIEMALLSSGIKVVEVTPQKWQKVLQLGAKGNSTTSQWKNRLKTKAQQLFPNVKKITLATADALLILEYARITEKV